MSATATIAGALAATTTRLAAAGIAEARADAEVLLADALATDRAGLVVRGRDALPPAAAERFAISLARRLRREPVFQVVGRREFWSMDLAVDHRVLCPRPETEVLVEMVLVCAPAARRVLDCGTGSGAVAAALARERPRAQLVASDRSADALVVAAENLGRLAPGADVVCADWLTAFRAGAFDVVVSNPPYVERAVLATLAPEVRDYEPTLALDGGPDGLEAVHTLLATAGRVLAPGGWLVLELGAGQAPRVCARATAAGWRVGRVARDAAGIERVVALQRAGEARGDG